MKFVTFFGNIYDKKNLSNKTEIENTIRTLIIATKSFLKNNFQILFTHADKAM